MLSAPGLFAAHEADIRHKHWYRQRFDACPHFMFFLGDAHVSRIQTTVYPWGQYMAYAGFSHNRADWYHSTDELWRTANAIIEAAQTNPSLSKDMRDAFQSYADEFYALCHVLESLDLSASSDVELLALYQQLADVYTNKLLSSPLIDGFALVTDEWLAGRIRVHLDAKGETERFVSVFEILTASTFTSFLAQEECALLRLALETQDDIDLRHARLLQHQQRFFWMQNNYVADRVLDLSFFEARLAQVDVDQAVEQLRVLSEQGQEHRQRKEVLMSELDLPDDVRVLLTITDDFAAWQDERKKGTFFATHAFTLLLQEISRRTGYPLGELVYALPPEMEAIMQKKISSTELRQRFEYCMVLWVGDEYDVITDQGLIQELDRIGTGFAGTVEELKGFAASRGIARGSVRVIESAQDIGRVQDGDVLVAVMTRPDYLPAMKRAVAFVTDEGGVTCHAAIVAREMRKPCVIGTKYATKVLQEGDLVEVDADKGTVRKMER